MATFGKAMTFCDVLALTLKRCIISNGSMLPAKPFSISTQNHENYDIIITGGGMVGSTLACAIANNRKLECKKILLLESNKQHEYKSQEKYSNRVVALNKQTRCLLSSIGAWQHIEAIRYSTVRKMQVWDACSDAMIVFNEDYLTEEIAYIVENDLLLHAVNKQLADKENVNIIYNSKVENIKLPKTQEEDAVIQLQDGTKYKSKLLIGADGVNSLVRKTMNTQYVKWDYNQMGIVATLKLSEPGENVVAWQRFLPSGPIALLPLTNDLSSLVWSLPIDEAKRLLKVSEEEFVDNINNALWKVYPKDGIVESGMKALQQLLEGLSLQTGVVRQLQPSISTISEGSRAAFPLQFGHSVSYVQTGTVLVGDAAHRVHPLAGQGVNLGFGDITVLVQLLAEAVISGVPIGNMMYLRKYETLRQRYNVPIMFAIDALHRLYNGTAAPIVLVRSLGLQLTNAIPVIKVKFNYFVIKEDFKKDPYEIFESIDPEPLGTASLAQVHKAVLKNGGIVAVKIQHRSVKTNSYVDIKTMSTLVKLTSLVFPDFKFDWLVDETKKNIPRELDFTQEGKNAEKIQNIFSHYHWLKIPKIHWEISSPRVLTMEFVKGGQVNDLKYIQNSNLNPYEVSSKLGRLYSHMIFIVGFVHSDPHPGNVLVRKKNNEAEIILLDHGLYANLSNEFRWEYSKLWLAIFDGNKTAMQTHCANLGVTDLYGLLACMVSGRSWNTIMAGVQKTKYDKQEKEEFQREIPNLLPQISNVLDKVNRQMLLILKTNDLMRCIEYSLNTGSRMSGMLEMSKCCIHSVYGEKLKSCTNVWEKWKISLSKQWALFKISLYYIYLGALNFNIQNSVNSFLKNEFYTF